MRRIDVKFSSNRLDEAPTLSTSTPIPPLRTTLGRVSTALFLLLVTSNAARAGSVPEPATVQSLLSAISQNPDYYGPSSGMDRKTTLAVELGEAALPQLESRLDKATNDQERESLGTAIAYIGGPSAITSLKAASLRGSSLEVKNRLAFVIPSAPSAELTVLLEKYLEGPHTGTQWPLIVQAAYSLGVMRAHGAVPALRATADQHEQYSTFASSAARDALAWIAGPDTTVRILAKGPNDDLLGAIVSAGIPTINRSSFWCESSAHRSWSRTRRTWTLKSGCSHGSEPTLGIDVFRSSDGQRAVVSIGFSLGPKDGAGYNYLLRKQGDHWVVTGLEFTWVA